MAFVGIFTGLLKSGCESIGQIKVGTICICEWSRNHLRHEASQLDEVEGFLRTLWRTNVSLWTCGNEFDPCASIMGWVCMFVCMYYHYCTRLFINNIAFQVYLYFNRLHDMSACLQFEHTQHVRPNIISLVKLLHCVFVLSMHLIIMNILGCLFLHSIYFMFSLVAKKTVFFSCLYLHNLKFCHLFTFGFSLFRLSLRIGLVNTFEHCETHCRRACLPSWSQATINLGMGYQSQKYFPWQWFESKDFGFWVTIRFLSCQWLESKDCWFCVTIRFLSCQWTRFWFFKCHRGKKVSTLLTIFFLSYCIILCCLFMDLKTI